MKHSGHQNKQLVSTESNCELHANTLLFSLSSAHEVPIILAIICFILIFSVYNNFKEKKAPVWWHGLAQKAIFFWLSFCSVEK